MSAGNLSVDSTGVGTVLLALGMVDKGNTLTEVPLSLSSTVNTLKLDKGGLRALEVLTTLVSEVASLNVKTIKKEKELDIIHRKCHRTESCFQTALMNSTLIIISMTVHIGER